MNKRSFSEFSLKNVVAVGTLKRCDSCKFISEVILSSCIFMLVNKLRNVERCGQIMKVPRAWLSSPYYEHFSSLIAV